MSVIVKTRHTGVSEEFKPYLDSTEPPRVIQVEKVTEHVYENASHFGCDAMGAIFVIKAQEPVSDLTLVSADGAPKAPPTEQPKEIALAVYGPGQWMSAEVFE